MNTAWVTKEDQAMILGERAYERAVEEMRRAMRLARHKVMETDGDVMMRWSGQVQAYEHALQIMALHAEGSLGEVVV